MNSELILNTALRATDIPAMDPRRLTGPPGDIDDGRAGSWGELWRFAMTFDGYSYFGDDQGVTNRVGAFNASVKEAFLTDGELPRIDLALLRLCLFFEQRFWCKSTQPPPTDDDRAYLAALLGGIRSAIA